MTATTQIDWHQSRVRPVQGFDPRRATPYGWQGSFRFIIVFLLLLLLFITIIFVPLLLLFFIIITLHCIECPVCPAQAFDTHGELQLMGGKGLSE
eukprot:1150277-Pelagomonas_calceolata.AAC.3